MNQIKSQIPLTSKEKKASVLKKTMVIVILFAAIAIFVSSGAFAWLLKTITGKPVETPVALVDSSAAAAAENGLKTMYTVDYEAGYDAWVSSICAISTDKGCKATVDLFGRSIKEGFEMYKTDQTVTAVKAIKKLDERTIDGVKNQMWAVEMTTKGWTEEQTETAVASVVQENGTWKFEMLVPVPPNMLEQMLAATPESSN